MEKSIQEIIEKYRKVYRFRYTRMIIEFRLCDIHISLRTLHNWARGESKPELNAIKGYLALSKDWSKKFFQEIHDFLEFENIKNNIKEKKEQ